MSKRWRRKFCVKAIYCLWRNVALPLRHFGKIEIWESFTLKEKEKNESFTMFLRAKTQSLCAEIQWGLPDPLKFNSEALNLLYFFPHNHQNLNFKAPMFYSWLFHILRESFALEFCFSEKSIFKKPSASVNKSLAYSFLST